MVSFHKAKTTMENRTHFRLVLGYAWHYARRRPATLGFTALVMLALAFVEVLIPVFAGRLIDAVSGLPSEPGAVDAAVAALIGFLAAAAAFTLIRDGAVHIWAWYQSRTMQEMTQEAYDHIQRLGTDWHADAFAGATVRKVTRGMRAFEIFSDTLYFGLVPAAVVLTAMTAYTASRWPLLGLLMGVIGLIYVGVSIALVIWYAGPAHTVANEQDSRLGGALSDALSCVSIVKSFGAENREAERLSGVARDWQRAELGAWRRGIFTQQIQGAMGVVFFAALLGYALKLWLDGDAGPGDVGFVFTSAMIINGWLRDIGMHVRHLQTAMSDLEDIALLEATQPAVADLPDAPKLIAQKGQIGLQAVRFGYEDRDVFAGLDLEIAAGEKVGLVGRSGSGKSTLIKLVQRLYDLRGGRILIDGQDIAGVTQASLRRQIALVPQDPMMFHRSLAENIAYARPDASEAEIRDAARRAHAAEFIEALPDGYGTLVGERGIKLSGGERQRVAIARAILADAPILILDEATSALDSVSEALVQEALEDLMAGRTTLVVAHRLSTIRAVDRILVFEAGRIVEQGSHEALLARDGGTYRRLHNQQALGLIDADAAPVQAVRTAA